MVTICASNIDSLIVYENIMLEVEGEDPYIVGFSFKQGAVKHGYMPDSSKGQSLLLGVF